MLTSRLEYIVLLNSRLRREILRRGRGTCRAVFEALQNQLQPCDVVVVHNHREKFYGFGLINALTALQNVVKAKGASLVILGDTPTLPARGTYCIDSPTSPDASERCAYVWDAPDSPMLGDKQSDESSAVAYNLLAQDESTYFFDTRSLLCTDDGHCGATVPGTSTLAFFDDHHGYLLFHIFN